LVARQTEESQAFGGQAPGACLHFQQLLSDLAGLVICPDFLTLTI
jgi:hypothetical protein